MIKSADIGFVFLNQSSNINVIDSGKAESSYKTLEGVTIRDRVKGRADRVFYLETGAIQLRVDRHQRIRRRVFLRVHQRFQRMAKTKRSGLYSFVRLEAEH